MVAAGPGCWSGVGQIACDLRRRAVAPRAGVAEACRAKPAPARGAWSASGAWSAAWGWAAAGGASTSRGGDPVRQRFGRW